MTNWELVLLLFTLMFHGVIIFKLSRLLFRRISESESRLRKVDEEIESTWTTNNTVRDQLETQIPMMQRDNTRQLLKKR